MKIIEVGAGDFSSCYSKRFLDTASEIILFEPNKVLYDNLVGNLKSAKNVKIFNNAVGDDYKKVKFFNLGIASWVESAPSFTARQVDLDNNQLDIEQHYQMLTSMVDMVPISAVDKGDIDYLSINCNGSELAALSRLTSHPKVIRTCLYVHNQYQWAAANELMNVLANAGYKGNIINKSKLDTYFEIEFVKI